MIDTPELYRHFDEHRESTDDVEKGLLGAMFKKPDCILGAVDAVCGNDFRDERFGRLFDFVVKLGLAGEPIQDFTFLIVELRKAGLLELIGGPAAVARLADDGLPQHARHYSIEIAKWASIRRIRNAAASILVDTDTHNPAPRQIADDATRRIIQAIESRESDLETVEMVCDETLAGIDAAMRSGQAMGLPTGIQAIDDITGGLFAELTIVAARPSVGKTAMGLELATRAASAGKRVLFCSLEMTSEQIGHRLLSRETGIPISDIRAGKLTTLQRSRLDNARSKMKSWAWRFWAQGGVTVGQIQAKARMHASRFGLDLLVIDYLGLIRGTNANAKAYERISQISNDLATLTKQIGKPVVCLCQLSRGAETDRPRLDHLRDSGAIEQDADNVWFLHRERGKAETELIIAKARQGEVGTIDLAFDASRCAFSDKPATSTYQGGYFDDFAKR
jgi:replicative DNA helicase